MKSQTLFSLLLGIIFLGERLNKGETVGIVITIAGGIIVAYQKEGYLIFGTLTALLSAFFYSLLSFLIKKIAQDLNMLTVANLRALGVSIVVFIYLMITGRFEIPGLRDLMFMSFGGLTGAYIAKASQFQSIKLLDVSRSTAVMPMESLFVILFSYFLFYDLPSVIKLIGGAGIIIGVVFLVIFRGERNDVLGK
jgi:drug/metabolite transporter (DMT)-like permease